jgi:FkbM family methyltransferase
MNLLQDLFINFCSLLRINLLSIAYKGIGIAPKYHDLNEVFFKKVLPRYLKNTKEFVFFDVGANMGKVTEQMLQSFPGVQVHSFEPNPYTFNQLKKTINDKRATLNNVGLSHSEVDSKIYYYEKDQTTGHASMFKDVFDLHGSSSLDESLIRLTTLDHYCNRKKINHIDFLKIDTEGNDFFVLKGASHLISSRKIDVIQFEFNEMNIVSRVFLKDFYDLLKDFDLYRIKDDKLFSLGEYSSSNEIFKLQNLLAIRKK